MRARFIRTLEHLVAKPHLTVGGALALGALGIGFAWYATSVAPTGAYAAAATGSITEEVDVPATVKAAENTDLSFQISGQVASIRASIGQHVAAGQTLVALAGGSQAAAVALAEANLETQQAKLDALTAGTRPEQLAIYQTAAAQAENALADAIRSGYVSADDAVHVKADQVFGNPRTGNATLIPTITDSAAANRATAERIALEPALASLGSAVAAGPADPAALAPSAETALRQASVFLDDLALALSAAVPNTTVSASDITAYQASVNTARSTVSASLTALTNADTSYKGAAGTLALAKAGATQNDLNAQKALVDSARAALAQAEVAAGQTYLTAPVAGTVYAQNAHVGQTVTPGLALVSLIADGAYQADAQVSEADIAKVKVGDTVQATLAAYPGITFPATVTAVAPAAVATDGVSSYQVTVTFAGKDDRVRPGLSTSLRIITATKDGALVVPSSSIITDGSGSFVYRKINGASAKVPVEVGIRNAGSAEILSGLSAGDEVLTFGASATR